MLKNILPSVLGIFIAQGNVKRSPSARKFNLGQQDGAEETVSL